MHKIALILIAALLCACATTQSTAPREFLDEQTTATITVVSQPMIFVADASGPARRNYNGEPLRDLDSNRDYLEVYGFDVNRMGTHRQYIAVMKWQLPKQTDELPVLRLRTGADAIELKATNDDMKKIGVMQPLAPSYSRSAKWWYFPTDTATLRKIANAQELRAMLDLAEATVTYTMFNDGRAQLAELTAVLPQ